MPESITPDIVLHAYCVGIFPMGDPDGEISWHAPDPRCIFELDKLKISRSLRKTVDRGVFEVRINTAFERVMRECADRDEGTWITDKIIELYTELHARGFAHSVESWQDGQLVGGLYGVSIGAAFFGESMFHRVTDASKVALVHLVRQMTSQGYTLLDTQWTTPHLATLGAIEIPRDEYERRLDAAIRKPCHFTTESSEIRLSEP